VRFPTSCTSDAQPVLERGLALLHHMTYDQAEAEFRSAAQLDPDCAIAYWGAAMTFVHPLWPDTVPPEKLATGRELLDKARAARHSSKRERAYIAALQSYYTDEGDSSEADRRDRYASAWEDVFRKYGDDPEAKLFYALASLATASMSDKSYEKQLAAGALAEEVLAAIPQHPGAHHYIIHAYDSPPLASRALAAARTYGSVAPESSHALHMTSHIFTRLGLWAESIEFNRRAAAAASARTPAGAVSAQQLHALDYLAYAWLQTGNDAAARNVLEQVRALVPPYENNSATAYVFAAMPARYALERQDWAAATALTDRWPDAIPWNEYPYLVAIPEFARAIGGARSGNLAVAKEAIDAMAALQEQSAALDTAHDWAMQVAIEKTGAEAWLKYASGDVDAALALMEEAADMESSTEKNPVTPGEVLPARELYGDMLLAAGRYGTAREQYEVALVRSPNRFNSLFGAGRAAELNGNLEGAASFYRRLLEICAGTESDRPQLVHARAAVKVLEAGV
jgi:tetratricopeptide (TPR) repeat protein